MKQSPKIALLLFFSFGVFPLQGESRFMTCPDIHGDSVAFSYDGDLWLTTVEGTPPIHLTTDPGGEAFPKFSPDGKWIAYLGNYQGASDVYLIPASGGTPRRLTWLPGPSIPVGWTPDGKYVVFSSTWGRIPVSRDTRLFRVALDGSLPEPLPVDRGVNCSFSADGSRLLYTRRGVESYYWKRYKGGRYPEIWLADLSTKSFKRMTDYAGRNAFPMWIGETMYFNSDRGQNGITNLYAQDLKSGAVRQVTRFTDFDVMTPSTDRKRIVFVQNGFLHVLEPGDGSTRRIPVNIPGDDWRLQERWINPADYLQFMDVGGDGRSVVLDARGDLFHLSLGEAETESRNLTGTPGVRERFPRLSPDGKRIAYFSDTSGEYQVYVRDLADGSVTQLTDGLKRTCYHLVWSPDGRKLLFGNRDFTLFWLDVSTRELSAIDTSRYLDNDEFTWEVSDYTWSPDSRWVAYSFPQENRNNAIFLYDTNEGKRYPVTGDFYDNLNPRFDVGGGFLYFLSNRNYQIGMDLFEDNHIVVNPTRVMALQLRKGEKPPFAKPVTDEGDAPSEASSDSLIRHRIDTDGLSDRIFELPVDPGNYFHLAAGKGKVLWVSVPAFTESEYQEFFRFDGATKWSLHLFSMNDRKTVICDDKVAEMQVSTNGEQLIVRREGKLFTSSIDQSYGSKKVEREIDLSGLTYRVSPREEWLQIFNDTWRWYRDFFYDKDMHGRDWKAIGETYRSYIKDVRTRQQLNWVLSEMVGELCVSHTYISGGDNGPGTTPPTPVLSTGLLGADLEADATAGRYRFARIYGPTPYFSNLETPLARPDVAVKEGDYLLAINGTQVRPPDNYFRLLQVGKAEAIELTVGSTPDDSMPRTYRVRLTSSDRDARYARWVSDNVDQVLEQSEGKVGYMHITAMGGRGIMEFDKFWRAFRYKDGLVIDVRGNGGGWTEYFMIDKLERQQIAFNVLQGMEPYRYPNPASRAHFVLLSNEDNGSDGEAFVEHFKARKLGTVVGAPSWGGLVGIVNGQKTIDNGQVEQSNNAFYGRDGQWLVENHGADPDILQENDPAAVLEGRDQQLERAVAVALEKIQRQPWRFPEVPKYPKK